MSVRIDGVMVLSVLGVIAVGGVAYFLKKNGSAIVDAVNPASDKNLAYGGVNSVATSLGMDGKDSIATAFYNATHETYDPNDRTTAGEPFSLKKTAGGLFEFASLFNPAAAAGTAVVKAAGVFAQKNTDDLGGINFGIKDSEIGSWD